MSLVAQERVIVGALVPQHGRIDAGDVRASDPPVASTARIPSGNGTGSAVLRGRPTSCMTGSLGTMP